MNSLTYSSTHAGAHLSDLNQFLIDNEKRAFRIALSAVGHHEEALEIVQDSMLKLARLYSKKTEQEWKILFNRILQSRIRDWYRRQKVRRAAFGWLPKLSEDDESDPIEQVPMPGSHGSESDTSNGQVMAVLERAIQRLPTRQREAFLLRCWQGFSTTETAAVMKVSEGSVKTHYSRALATLQSSLEGVR